MSEQQLIYHVTGKLPFDFNHPEFHKHGSEMIEYLFKNHNKPITEEEFLSEIKSWPNTKVGKARKKRTPSNIKIQYRRLVNRYGFFPGGQDESI